MNFLQALQHCINQNLIFAAYRLPHSDAVRLVVQKSQVVKKVEISTLLFEQQGFLISPFVEGDQDYSHLIEPDLNYISTNYVDFDELLKLPAITSFEPDFENGVVGRKEFTVQVDAIKQAIEQKQFEKAVISRIKVIERNYRSKLTDIFQLLISSYSNAFIYLFNMNGQLWMGATPEPLLCWDKNNVETVSLAGTREYNAENLNINNWGKKELIEQELVTCYIDKALRKLGIDKYHAVGPYTKRAGNLVHLRTNFTIKHNKVDSILGDLIKELHPTSAVCGLPKREAMDFILRLEKHKRKYYSGFLGPINLDQRLQLYVNLRCMQILSNRLVLYIGVGITSDSNPDDEWAETEIKADTLLAVIHKV